MTAPKSRDAQTNVRYFRPDAPRSDHLTFKRVVMTGTDPSDTKSKETQTRLVEGIIVQDARQTPGGGLAAWSLETHGFCFVPAPAGPEKGFADYAAVRAEFEPRLLEAAIKATGASRAFWMGHARRTQSFEYSRIAHTDFGPEFEPLFRRTLVQRWKVPLAEAESCGMMVLGYWAPVENPAYKRPLCLLDGSRRDPREAVPFMTLGNIGYSRVPGKEAERIPLALQDAPSYGPTYSAADRWVYVPDMLPSEAVFFKHYDFRPKGASAKVAYHNSFDDNFWANWKECPSRRSVECRVLLTFDNEVESHPSSMTGAAAAQNSKL